MPATITVTKPKRRKSKSTYKHHGQSNAPVYRVWCSMIQRCVNPNHNRYNCYGGAGVIVCERWMNSFENFLADMGERPEGMEIDRWPDRSGNYEPGNTRWATPKQNSRNRSDNKIVTVRGMTGCVAELCEYFKVPYGRTNGRLWKGWPVEEAFFSPPAKNQFTRIRERP